RLGFMRGEFDGSGFPTKVSEQNRIPRISLLTAADYFSSKFRHRIAEVRDDATPLRRVRMNFPKIPSLYTPVLEMTATYEDVLLRERLGKEFLIPLRRKSEKELQLTDELDLQTFLRLWRFLSFLGLVDIAVLRQHADRDATIVHNS